MMTENKSVVSVTGRVKETWVIKGHEDTFGIMRIYINLIECMYIILIVVFDFTGVYIDRSSLNCILKYFQLIVYQLCLKTMKTVKIFISDVSICKMIRSPTCIIFLAMCTIEKKIL